MTENAKKKIVEKIPKTSKNEQIGQKMTKLTKITEIKLIVINNDVAISAQ